MTAVTGFNTADDASRVLKTLRDALAHCMEEPSVAKYRKFNTGNPGFQKRIGSAPGGVDVLQAAGFVSEGGEGEAGVKMLRLRRDDPGLLWLCLSAIDEAHRKLQGAR